MRRLRIGLCEGAVAGVRRSSQGVLSDIPAWPCTSRAGGATGEVDPLAG